MKVLLSRGKLKVLICIMLIFSWCLFAACSLGDKQGMSQKNENYGFDYHVMIKYRTQYVGDASSVGNIIYSLPSINEEIMQNYFSLQTEKKPYEVNIFYESKDEEGLSALPTMADDSREYKISKANSLALFSLIDNLDVVNIYVRKDKAGEELVDSEYGICATFTRKDLDNMIAVEKITENNINDLKIKIEKILQ